MASPQVGVVRIAVLGGRRELMKSVEPRGARFEVVASNEDPDLVWDPSSRDVLSGGDLIARRVDLSDLPAVIDRVAAVNGFKRLATKLPQNVRVLPDDNVHRRDTRIEVQLSGMSQRSLLLFNIAGDGTIQLLFPIGSDPSVIATSDYKFPVLVGEPFGADQVVAITSPQRLNELEAALKGLNHRRMAIEVYKLVERLLPSDARIGAVSLFSAP